MGASRSWLLVVGDVAARDLARNEWRRIALPRGEPPRPAAGDRIAVLRTHRPLYATAAVFVGTAGVRGVENDALLIRHRFVAPTEHETALVELTHLHVSVGWTHERVKALIGQAIPLTQEDYDAIEAVLRNAALTFGPPAKRPAHRMARTPGRRALSQDRVAARRLRALR